MAKEKNPFDVWDDVGDWDDDEDEQSPWSTNEDEWADEEDELDEDELLTGEDDASTE